MVASMRWIFGMLLLLAAIVGLVLWSAGEGVARVPTAELPGARGAAEPAPATAAIPSSNGAVDSLERAAAAPPRSDAGANADGTAPIVQVRVLGSNQRPAVDASVDVEVPVMLPRETRRSDADGFARFPLRGCEQNTLHVRATATNAAGEVEFGELWIRCDEALRGVQTLTLMRDLSAEVVVRTAAGQPAVDVPVTARFVRNGEDANWPLGNTKETGRLRLEHMQEWMAGIDLVGGGRPLVVFADLPGVLSEAHVDGMRLPVTPIELRLPPCGRIAVTVRDALGEVQTAVGVGCLDAEVPLMGPDLRPFKARTDASGCATFPLVGLGHRWRIGAGPSPGVKEWRVVVGPTAADELVEVLVQPTDEPVLSGRLVRDGKPVPQQALLPRFAGRLGWRSTQTDDQGAFRIAIHAGWVGRQLTECELSLRSKEGIDDETAIWRGERQLVAGDNPLGDVVVTKMPMVVAGRLLVPDHMPPPAAVRAVVQAATGVAGAPWCDVDLRWQIASDGRFAAFGPAPAAPLRVAMHVEGFLPVSPLPFLAGEQDLRVELQRGGSLRIVVRFSDYTAASCVEALLESDDVRLDAAVLAPWSRGFDWRLPIEPIVVRDAPLEQALVWPALPPGRYRAQLYSRGQRQPVHTIDGLEVVDGQRNEVAEVVDLSSLQDIWVHVPQLREIDGYPHRTGTGVAAVVNGDVPGERLIQLDGATAVFASSAPIDVLLRAPGYRDTIVCDVFGRQDLRLEPGIAVELVVAGGGAAAGEGAIDWSLILLDDPLLATPRTLYSPAAGGANAPLYVAPELRPTQAAKPLQFAVPRAGRYAVRWRRVGDPTATAQAATPPEITVCSSGGGFAVVR
jgi:hypothetical protein